MFNTFDFVLISQLYIYDEIQDHDPYYPAVVNIYREVRPKYIAFFGSMDNSFSKVLIDLVNGSYETTISTDTARSLPQNMTILLQKHYREYKFFFNSMISVKFSAYK